MAAGRMIVLVTRMRSPEGETMLHKLHYKRLGRFFHPHEVPEYPGEEQWFDAQYLDGGLDWVFHGFAYTPDDQRLFRPLWQISTSYINGKGRQVTGPICQWRMHPGEDVEKVAGAYHALWKYVLRQRGLSEGIADKATFSAVLIDPGVPLPPLPKFDSISAGGSSRAIVTFASTDDLPTLEVEEGELHG